jgi:hypothetical protein
MIPMSDKPGRFSGGAMTLLGGLIMALLGVALTFYAFTSEAGAVNPRVFTPVGVFILLLGLLMLASKEG